MVNTSGPTGSVSYQADPSAPGGYRQVTSLSPEQQGLYALGNAAQTGALGTANSQLDRINSTLSRDLSSPDLQRSVGPTDFSADRDAMTDAVYSRAKSRLDPMYEQAENRERNRLSNQGLSQNSTAYGNSMDTFNRGKTDAYDAALSSAIMAGGDEQNRMFNQALQQGQFSNAAAQQGYGNDMAGRNQMLNEFAALLGAGNGGGIVLPQSYGGGSPGVSPTDVMGAFGLNASQAQNAYNAKVSEAASGNQATAGLASAAISAAIMASMMSDRRTKKDITRVGERPDGIGLYTFRYRSEADESPLRYGVMADEVERVRPEAVTYDDRGIAYVNYGIL